MIRLAFLFIGAYTLGHPYFDSYRPDVLSEPLVKFHNVVNSAAEDVAGIGPGFQKAVQPDRLLEALKISELNQ